MAKVPDASEVDASAEAASQRRRSIGDESAGCMTGILVEVAKEWKTAA
jgi:hypothetical protein